MNRFFDNARGVRRHLYLWAPAVLLIMLLGGCGDPSQELKPPRADVADIQRLVVFPFDNTSGVRDLQHEMTDGLVEILSAVGWYEVIPPSHVQASLEELGFDAWDDISPDTARDVALDLGADGALLGAVTGYDDAVHLAAPYASESEDEDAPLTWHVDQTTAVEIAVSVRLINAHTNEAVYKKTATGRGLILDVRELNWVIPQSPPDHVIPAAHRRHIGPARQGARQDVYDQFAADLLPRSP